MDSRQHQRVMIVGYHIAWPCWLPVTASSSASIHWHGHAAARGAQQHHGLPIHAAPPPRARIYIYIYADLEPVFFLLFFANKGCGCQQQKTNRWNREKRVQTCHQFCIHASQYGRRYRCNMEPARVPTWPPPPRLSSGAAAAAALVDRSRAGGTKQKKKLHKSPSILLFGILLLLPLYRSSWPLSMAF
jgi:hypothetical protein